MIFEVPSCYLMEYSKAMKSKFGIDLSESYLSQFLAKHDINRKKVLSFWLYQLILAYIGG